MNWQILLQKQVVKKLLFVRYRPRSLLLSRNYAASSLLIGAVNGMQRRLPNRPSFCTLDPTPLRANSS